jgi:hypothetical protein
LYDKTFLGGGQPELLLFAEALSREFAGLRSRLLNEGVSVASISINPQSRLFWDEEHASDVFTRATDFSNLNKDERPTLLIEYAIRESSKLP